MFTLELNQIIHAILLDLAFKSSTHSSFPMLSASVEALFVELFWNV